MRTVGATIAAMALLAESAIGVAAQERDAAAGLPIAVEGNTTCEIVDRGTMGYSDALVQRATGIRGQVLDCVGMSSDPRASGASTVTFNDDCFPSEARTECVVWGTSTGADATGTGWDCSFAGTSDPMGDNDAVALSVCAGTGDYEGLTHISQFAISFMGESDFGDGTSEKGIIYEGEPPPMALPFPGAAE